VRLVGYLKRNVFIVLKHKVYNIKVLYESTCVLYTLCSIFLLHVLPLCRSQRPRGLRRTSTAARPLRSWVRIPPGAWMFVCCECCVLSLRRIDHSFRGVLPTVARRCVWSRNLENEEAKARIPGCGKYNQKRCNAKKTNKQHNNMF